MLIRFDDEETKHHSETLLMNIVPSASDPTLPTYEVESWSDPDAEEPTREQHSPQEVAAKYLRKVKETAENFLGRQVQGCVVSTPVHFAEEQRSALIKAVREAGFSKAYTIHEPVAAALAFDSANQQQKTDQSDKRDRLVLVLDLGGHQFNVTLLSSNHGLYTVVTSLDDERLGGVHFDEILMNFVQQEFKRKTKLDIGNNRRARAKLQRACEQTKRALTRQDNAPCSVESLFEGMDYHGTVPRGRFEMLAEPLYARCVEVIRRSLSEADVQVDEIDEVLLVGGASRMPRFQAMTKSVFPSSTIRSDVEPDEAISSGCAVQAGIILSTPCNIDYAGSARNKDVIEAMHLSKSIGLEGPDGAFVRILPKRAPIPSRRRIAFALGQDGQREVYLAVYEGEASIAKQNKLIAELVLSDLPEGLASAEASIEVTFTVEKDEILTIVATEKKSGATVKTKVQPHGKK